MIWGRLRKGFKLCVPLLVICLFAGGCERSEVSIESDVSVGSEVSIESAVSVGNEVSAGSEVSIDSDVSVGSNEGSDTQDSKIDPRITLEVSMNKKSFVGYSGKKTVEILGAEAFYNDNDLAFPTIFVTFDVKILNSANTDEAVPVEYRLWTGLPPSEEAKGIINLGGGYDEGEEFSFSMELKNLMPGIAYCLDLYDGKDTIDHVYGGEQNAPLNEGQLVLATPYMPDPESEGLYDSSFVVDKVEPVSVSFGTVYDAISFVFRDTDGKSIGAPATVDIRFVGDSGNTIYESSVTLTKDNFHELRYEYDFEDLSLEGVNVVGKLLIPAGQLMNKDTEISGTLYLTFRSDGVFEPIECSFSCAYPEGSLGDYVYDKINWPDPEPGVIY